LASWALFAMLGRWFIAEQAASHSSNCASVIAASVRCEPTLCTPCSNLSVSARSDSREDPDRQRLVAPADLGERADEVAASGNRDPP